jgi:hypothetical protein
MLKNMRKKEMVLAGLSILFIVGFMFYSRLIAPTIGRNAIVQLQKRIKRQQKKLNEEQGKEKSLMDKQKQASLEIQRNREMIERWRAEADIFKKKILSDTHEIDLFQFLFGRDARYNVVGLGNNQRRFPKGSYTEIVYDYKVQGQFLDTLKLIKKVETTSRSLSISSITLSRPKIGEEDGQEDDGSIIAELEIHVILSSLENALSYDEFMENAPDIALKKIDGNPWDENFGSGASQAEGPTGAIKRLWLKSVFYMYDVGKRAVIFEGRSGWYKEGSEFEIEAGKSSTRAKIIAIGGRYVVLRHLNKNLTFKMSLNVNNDGDEEQRNIKEVIDFKF